jgi:hypothetical protein
MPHCEYYEDKEHIGQMSSTVAGDPMGEAVGWRLTTTMICSEYSFGLTQG